MRPKSAFLGQYDLNYTCEMLYYARAVGELHALRECRPLELRETLRTDYRALALAGYFRELTLRLAPQGPDAEGWFDLLGGLESMLAGTVESADLLVAMLTFELKGLHLLGLSPEIDGADGVFYLRGERQIPISSAVMDCLKRLPSPCDLNVLLDSARVIGVYYQFHVDVGAETRRSVLKVLQTRKVN